MEDRPDPLSPRKDYLAASREPLTGLLFTAPIFLLYHVGVWWLHRYGNVPLINAANATLLRLLSVLDAAAPVTGLGLVVLVLVIQQSLRPHPWRRPKPSTWGWMAVESLAFAIPVFFLARVVDVLLGGAPLLSAVAPAGDGVNIPWMADGTPLDVGRAAEAILALGAGVYEEFFFRVLLLGAAAFLLERLARMGPARLAVAAVAQALLFAAIHHYYEGQEAFTLAKFAFRTVAGVYFAFLYLERGFGVAAGAHTVYDLLVIFLPVASHPAFVE